MASCLLCLVSFQSMHGWLAGWVLRGVTPLGHRESLMGRKMARVAGPEPPSSATGPPALVLSPSPAARFHYKPGRCCRAFITLLISRLFLSLPSWCWFALKEAENTTLCCPRSFCFTCTEPGLQQCWAVPGDGVGVTCSEKPWPSRSHREKLALPHARFCLTYGKGPCSSQKSRGWGLFAF